MIERMKVIRSAVFDLPLCLGLSVLATIIDEYAKKNDVSCEECWKVMTEVAAKVREELGEVDYDVE